MIALVTQYYRWRHTVQMKWGEITIGNESLVIMKFRLVLKFIYTGKILLQEYTTCIGLKKKSSAGQRRSERFDRCTHACGSFKNSEDKVDCIFTDFQKFQRLVELSELIGFFGSKSMTFELCLGWLNRWCGQSATPGKKTFTDKNTECQYYINMYKLIKNTVPNKISWVSTALNKLRRLLLDHSQNFTATGFYFSRINFTNCLWLRILEKCCQIWWDWCRTCHWTSQPVHLEY